MQRPDGDAIKYPSTKALRPNASLSSLAEQRCWQNRFLLELLHGALPRFLVGPPSQDCRAVPKAAASEMVIGHLDDKFRLERLPLRRAPGRPAARATRSLTGQAIVAD